jgi:hypothetical protein
VEQTHAVKTTEVTPLLQLLLLLLPVAFLKGSSSLTLFSFALDRFIGLCSGNKGDYNDSKGKSNTRKRGKSSTGKGGSGKGHNEDSKGNCGMGKGGSGKGNDKDCKDKGARVMSKLLV